MRIFGIMMAVVGLILLLSARGIYKGGKSATDAYKDMPGDNDAFLMLLSNSMIVFKIIGVLLLIAGVIFMFI